MSQDKVEVNNDEIDLVQLVMTLWAGKWIILMTVLVFIGLGYLFASREAKVYEYQSEVTAADLVDYNRLYVGMLKNWRPEPNELFNVAVDLFKSNHLTARALETVRPKDLKEEDQQAWLDSRLRSSINREYHRSGFSEKKKNKKDEAKDYYNDYLTLIYRCQEPRNCKTFLNNWTKIVHQSLVDLETDRIKQQISDLTADLSFNAQRMQDLHKINSSYYIRIFEEAKQLASKLDIRENQHAENTFEMGEFLQAFKASTNPELDSKSVKDNIENLGLKTPLYLYGTQTLSAIIEALSTRKEDAGFIEALAKTEYEIQQWKAVDLDATDVRFFNLLSDASPVSVKSNRRLYVPAFALLGLLISIIIVLIRGAVKQREIAN